MSYIVTNKWLRSGYGEGLRAYFAAQARLERIIDFGHAPIFADADVFPVIIVVERPAEGTVSEDHEVQVSNFPREALGVINLDSFVTRYSHNVPQRRLGRNAWSLEASSTDDLMEKIRQAGPTLTEYAGVKPYRGVLTGFNEAFLIDTPTRDRLIHEDPQCAAIIKPYLRGQDIKRWTPAWAGLWMIFTRRGIEIDAYPSVKNHLLRFREQLEPRPKDWTGKTWAGRKPGNYQWYEIQDSVDYWGFFEHPKILYQEIQFHSVYSIDFTGYFSNNKVFLIPNADSYLLAVLNSPLMWWHNWRYLPHMKDEALNPAGFLIEKLPIAPATDAIREAVEPAVAQLIAITQREQAARRDTLDWLRSEFDLENPGQKLTDFAILSETEFIEEVKKRRPKAAGKLSPSGLRALRNGYHEQAPPVQQNRANARQLEHRLATLVNTAYGLTPEEIALMWETAPPRMPAREQ
ncbi:TaqI-like C-terminal specificity domain-containing protein [Candidatus Chloroploca asiatica]|uniref:site-specific DNA-methyltransferase (adenine-specific) n=1 Tax=Candidatus Chloroploca asiatica TaxID=1506545 RepID=A0A2H3KPS9_9CHLR|nr:TaqI-like C-terminal specificity domain-containing protein [Candidatus Chloroploca asiatica]PDW00292.1 hypothetical protein A9Q02_21850 [Candidatus Chloroploca asiatica]